MLTKISALVIVGFAGLTQAQESLFSLFKQQKAPEMPMSEPLSLGTSAQWTEYTNTFFRNCDSNKSGYITQNEYEACSKNNKNWAILQSKFDANRDYLLSWSESYNAVKYYDNHFLSMTDLTDKNMEGPPAGLDEKMSRLKFLYTRIVVNGKVVYEDGS
jgi:hypothetical protein